MWKIMEKVVLNLNTPFFFKWHAIRLFNSLPQPLRTLTNCSVHLFKNRLHKYLSTLL